MAFILIHKQCISRGNCRNDLVVLTENKNSFFLIFNKVILVWKVQYYNIVIQYYY